MMYGMSPLRRALYFVLPLVFALLFTAIVAIDAANTPHPTAELATVEVEEGHHWLLFDFGDAVEAGNAVDGVIVTVETARETVAQEATAGESQLLFDLGEAAEVQSVRIEWPDGREQRFTNVSIDRRIPVDYPDTAWTSIAQWFDVAGPVWWLLLYAVLGLLIVLLAIRIVVWAESRSGAHGEVFMR